MADPKSKAAAQPPEPSPNAKPQGPAPKAPQGQQATQQQTGPTGAKPSEAPAGPPPNGGASKPGPKGPGGPGGKGPEGPPPLPIGPSPELSKAYEFLQGYVMQNMAGGLPPEMLNGGDPDAGSPLNNLGQALPATITGDLKTFPKYSLATGAPNSPGLPTGLTPSALIGGIPKGVVAAQQLKMTPPSS